MKIQVVAVLLLALSVIEISEALDFFQKHVVKQMAPDDCKQKMTVINEDKKKCKEINTFFLDQTGVLTGICNHNNNRSTMNIALNIIDCKYDKKNPYPDCTYRSVPGKATSVTVLCDQNRKAYHLENVVRG